MIIIVFKMVEPIQYVENIKRFNEKDRRETNGIIEN